MWDTATFGIDVESKLAFRVFSAEVDLASWSLNALGSYNEMMN